MVDWSCPETICLLLVLASWGKGTAKITLSATYSAYGFNGVEVTKVMCFGMGLWTDWSVTSIVVFSMAPLQLVLMVPGI